MKYNFEGSQSASNFLIFLKNLKITLDLGIPNEDNEWQFDLTTVGEPAIFHRRKNNEIWYYTYDSTTFQLAEEPIRYIAQ